MTEVKTVAMPAVVVPAAMELVVSVGEDSSSQDVEFLHDGIPAGFQDRLRSIYSGEIAKSILAQMRAPKATAFRVATLRRSSAEVFHELESQRLPFSRVSWFSSAALVEAPHRVDLLSSDVYLRNDIYVQDLSSMLVALELQAQPGEVILDLAAAPGGKLTLLAERMLNQGQLSAVEPIRSRYYRLREMVERLGVTIVRMYRTDGRSVGRKTPERFDRVLLDAPCSGEARFHVDQPQSWQYWSERKIREQSRKQIGLLLSGLHALKRGGFLIYSTCAFAPEENERVVNVAMRKFPGELEIVPPSHRGWEAVSHLPGRTSWGRESYAEELHHARRILPSESHQGFFLAKIVKHS
jgi:16S rRNA (cytosine1407-C5)-methyltransferase